MHPLILFTDHRGEGYVESAQELPAGWKIEQDTNYEDNSDLQPTQLVGCVDRVKEIPTGTICEFDRLRRLRAASGRARDGQPELVLGT